MKMFTRAVVMNSSPLLLLGFGTAWKFTLVFHRNYREKTHKKTNTKSHRKHIASTDIAIVCSKAGLTGIAKFLTLPTLNHAGLWEHTQVVILWSTGVH